MTIKKILLVFYTAKGKVTKTVAPNHQKGYSKKDIRNVEKWATLLSKAGEDLEVSVSYD